MNRGRQTKYWVRLPHLPNTHARTIPCRAKVFDSGTVLPTQHNLTQRAKTLTIAFLLVIGTAWQATAAPAQRHSVPEPTNHEALPLAMLEIRVTPLTMGIAASAFAAALALTLLGTYAAGTKRREQSPELVRKSARNPQLYNDFFQKTNEIFCIIDGAGGFIRTNARFHQYLGWHENDLNNKTLPELVRDIAPHQLLALLHDPKSEKDGFSTLIETKSGVPRWISWQMKADAQNSTYFLAGRGASANSWEQEQLSSLKDELELHLKQRAASVRLGEEHIRSAMRESVVGMGLVAPDGTWLEVNEILCDIVGYSREELIGTTFQHITHPDDLEIGKEVIRRTALGELDTSEFEKRYIHKNGRVIRVYITVALIRHPDGTPRHFVSQIQDITEHTCVNMAMKAVSHDLAPLQGAEFFNEAALQIASILGADMAFIARIAESTPVPTAHTLAFVKHGELQPNVEYPTPGTPCEQVIKGVEQIIEQGVSTKYPCNDYLIEGPIESYGAVPLMDPGGKTIGHLGILKRHSDLDATLVEAVLKIFALTVSSVMLKDRHRRHVEALFEFAPDAIIMSDTDGTIRDANQQVESLFGWTRDQIIGQPVETLVPENRRQSHRKLREAYQKNSTPRPMGLLRNDLFALRKDGTEFPVEISLAPMDTDSGLMVAAAVRDITQRLHADAALQREQALLRALMENLGEGVVACNAEGKLSFFNKTARVWHGCDIKEIPPTEWPQHFNLLLGDGLTPMPPDQIPLRIAFRGKTVRGAEMAIAAAGQPTRFLLANADPLFNEAGAIVGAVAVMHDVTERRSAEVERSQALSTLDATEDAIFMFHATTLQFQYCNMGAIKQLGYTREELLTMTPIEIKPEFDEPMFRAAIQPLLSGEVSLKHFTTIHRHKDGHDIPVEINLQLVSLPGAEPRFVAAVRDVTEVQKIIKQLEVSTAELKQAKLQVELERDYLERRVTERTHELQHAKELAESANTAKSAFLATMSHEIRTPMNGVIGTVDVLRMSSLRPHQLDLVNTIRESAFSLLTVIDDVLDFSKLEADKLEIEQEPISLVRTIESVRDILHPIAERKGVKLRLYVDPQIPPLISSDSVRLRQILNNLVGNAIKFSSRADGDDIVKVRAHLKSDDELEIAVIDNGIGMTPQTVSRLFNPFTQADSSTTRRYGGTGLGLSISKKLANRLAGDIAVSSAVNAGSTFTLTLPLIRVDSTIEDEYIPDLHGVHTRLIQPDEELAKEWRAYLEYAGAQVTIVDSRDDATNITGPVPPSGPIVIVMEEQDATNGSGADTPPTDDTASTNRYVIITEGRRRSPRLESPNIATLDHGLLRRADFLLAVAAVAGRAEIVERKSDDFSIQPEIFPMDSDEAAALGRLILVAEDNDINQKVVRSQLAILGYGVEIASDGREALSKWRQGNFSLLLTDLHMPDMDGYELVETIRSEEDPAMPIPIIAFTANITRGERQRCMETGMNDYLSKPVKLEILQERLSLWTAKFRESREPVPPSELEQDEDSDGTTLDTRILKDLVGNNPAVVKEFLDEFLRSLLETKAEIDEAYNREDWTRIGDLAHRLKSSSRSVGATKLGFICAKMENASKSKGPQNLVSLGTVFDQRVSDVVAAIESQEEHENAR